MYWIICLGLVALGMLISPDGSDYSFSIQNLSALASIGSFVIAIIALVVAFKTYKSWQNSHNHKKGLECALLIDELDSVLNLLTSIPEGALDNVLFSTPVYLDRSQSLLKSLMETDVYRFYLTNSSVKHELTNLALIIGSMKIQLELRAKISSEKYWENPSAGEIQDAKNITLGVLERSKSKLFLNRVLLEFRDGYLQRQNQLMNTFFKDL